MKKILITIGTRPEAIKMCPVVNELKKHKTIFDTKTCVTAQHREMLDQVLNIFSIKPDFDLNIMKKDQDLYDITSEIILKIRDILKTEIPDLVLVHGDTTTTFTVSLAAFYQKIPVGHVEAGLRTGNIYSPWPEEANRQLTTQIAKYHFAPTISSKKNLLKENVPSKNIIITGNTVIDSLVYILNKIKINTMLKSNIEIRLNHLLLNFNCNIKQLLKKRIILVTGHRRENFGQGFFNICNALREIALSNHDDVIIIYPVHLNPNVQHPVYSILSDIPNMFLIEPIDYEIFIYLMNISYLILTDSGGIQEEAPSLGKPVLVMRNTTERPEAIQAGTVKLVGTDKQLIINETLNLLKNNNEYHKMARAHNPYGDGKASKRIVDYIIKNICSV